MMTGVLLTRIPHYTDEGIPYQHLHIKMTEPQIFPQHLGSLTLPPDLDWKQGIVLEGRAPLWLYGVLLSQCLAAPWVACYEVRLFSAVIVSSQTSDYQPGNLLPLHLPDAVLGELGTSFVETAWTTVMNAKLEFQMATLPFERSDCQTLVLSCVNRADLDSPISYQNGNPTLSNLIAPYCLKQIELPEALDLSGNSGGIILYGAGPIWLYAHLVTYCRPLPWVAFFDVQSKSAIIIRSQRAELPIGHQIPIQSSLHRGPAILIGGPPDSGKSVFSNALRNSLLKHKPDLKLYVHRANWDGQGNFTFEIPDNLAALLSRMHEIKLHQLPGATELITRFFERQGKTTQNLRDLMSLTLVDVGGVPQPEKQPVVEQCTHYIIISSDPTKIQAWHDLCSSYLKPLAVIHSKRNRCWNVLQENPFLEVEAGPWERGITSQVQREILKRVLTVI